MKMTTRRSKLALAIALVVLGLARLRRQCPGDARAGFAGTTLAKATFGDLFSHVHSKTPQFWNEVIQTEGFVRPLRSAEHMAARWQHRLAHAPGPELRHRHPGERDVYEGDDPTCAPHVYTADTANNSFVDIGGGDVHLIRNETGAVAQTMAVQLIPAGATRREDAADPGNCSF